MLSYSQLNDQIIQELLCAKSFNASNIEAELETPDAYAALCLDLIYSALLDFLE